MVKRWTVGQSHFPRWAEGPSCETEATPEPINNMYKNHEKVWNTNTHLCVDLKTYLRSDAIAKADKNYQGVLCREVECDEFNYDEHFTFVETLPQPAQKLTTAKTCLGRFLAKKPLCSTIISNAPAMRFAMLP